jgi:methionyl-tRNA formyltransferase
MGTPEFAVPSLEILLTHGYPIVAVVSAPDKPRGRGREISATPVATLARLHKLPLLLPESLKEPSLAAEIAALSPDLIVVVAFRILPPRLFAIPRLGSINLHASLLPKYRGAAPINWAIINGESETGVTTFFLEEKVDTGGIILQCTTPIAPDEDAGSLHDRLAALGAAAVLDTVRLIEQGKANPQPQAHTAATAAPKIFKEDCRIDWSRPADRIRNWIRGLSPVPGAFTFHDGNTLKIFRASVADQPSSQVPGTVEVVEGSLSVHTGDRLLAVLEIQQEGKRRLGIAEFLRGYRIASGARLS